jgi:hypothetical protein
MLKERRPSRFFVDLFGNYYGHSTLRSFDIVLYLCDRRLVVVLNENTASQWFKSAFEFLAGFVLLYRQASRLDV